jgi:ferredoxin
MEITKVWIEEGCTACGICQDTCPDVFGADSNGEAFIKANYDVLANEQEIKEAAESCPVEIIKYE